LPTCGLPLRCVTDLFPHHVTSLRCAFCSCTHAFPLPLITFTLPLLLLPHYLHFIVVPHTTFPLPIPHALKRPVHTLHFPTLRCILPTRTRKTARSTAHTPPSPSRTPPHLHHPHTHTLLPFPLLHLPHLHLDLFPYTDLVRSHFPSHSVPIILTLHPPHSSSPTPCLVHCCIPFIHITLYSFPIVFTLPHVRYSHCSHCLLIPVLLCPV